MDMDGVLLVFLVLWVGKVGDGSGCSLEIVRRMI